MNDELQEATERIQRAMYRIRGNTALIGIGTMSDHIKKYVPASIPTCATDGHNIYFNPRFVGTMNDAELRFVMIHEVLHVSYSHHLRLEGYNLRIANMAMDYMVNGILVASSATADGFISMPAFGLYDEFFVGKKWSFETIYNYLIANADKYPDVQAALDAENSDTCPRCGGTKDKSDGEQGDAEGDACPAPGDNEISQDGGQGAGVTPCQCSGEGEGEGQGGSPRPGAMGGFDTWGEVWPAPAEVLRDPKKEHDKIQETLAQGDFMEKSFSPNGGSDGICGTVRDSTEDTVGWHQLKDYLQSVYAHENTWSRPNLLRIGHGYYPSRDKSAGTLHICLDTSGSVSERELNIFFANTVAICDEVGVTTLKIAYVDSVLRRPTGEAWHEIDVASGEEVEFVIAGRGGTNFDPVFDCIEEEQEDVQCLVYFTDGWGGAYNRPPDFPVFWATTDQPVQWWGQWGEWGETIEIAPARW